MVSNIFGSLDKLPEVGGAPTGKNPPVKKKEQDKQEQDKRKQDKRGKQSGDGDDKFQKEGRSKAYFPFALMLVDASDGRIVGMKMLSPKPDMHTMHESVPQKLLEELDELGFRPERIELHTELLYFLTKNALKKAYCMSVLQEEMPLVDEAREALVNQLLEGGMR